jgi:coproporphyrinogen III oxidase-like Fe-S oxidoreductase
MGTAINTLDEELVAAMKRAGVFSLSVAVESGSQYILSKIIKKPLKLEKIKLVAEWLRRHNIKSKGFFIFGMPGETKENMHETIKFAKQLRLDWCGFAIATPLPGSELYQTCKNKGYVGEIDWTNLYLNEAKIKTPDFTPEEVNKIYYRANIEINFKDNPNLKEGGNIDQALIDFKKVVKLVPHHIWAHACLAKTYLIKSKKVTSNTESKKLQVKAQKELETAISLNPTEEDLCAFINSLKKNIIG